MNNLIDILLNYTMDIPLNEFLERYRRLYLSRFIFISLFSLEEQAEMSEFYSSIAHQANNEGKAFCEKLIELIPEGNFENQLKVVAVYLAYGNPELENLVCSQEQLKEAREVAIVSTSQTIWWEVRQP